MREEIVMAYTYECSRECAIRKKLNLARHLEACWRELIGIMAAGFIRGLL